MRCVSSREVLWLSVAVAMPVTVVVARGAVEGARGAEGRRIGAERRWGGNARAARDRGRRIAVAISTAAAV